MVTEGLNYHVLARRLITLPFAIVLLFAFFLYAVVDITHTIRHEIDNTKVINMLLAKTAAHKNVQLTLAEVSTALNHSPMMANIVFVPINSSQNLKTDDDSIQTILFSHYLGLNEPVMIELITDNTISSPTVATPIKQLIGYMNITLDLRAIRLHWFKQNLPLFLLWP